MSQEIETHVLAKYKQIKKIGSGAYGHVFKVSDRKTKKIKALKKNFDAFNNSTDAQRTYRQIMFLMQLKHPNIIILQEVIPSENGKDIYLVFEHMDADLHLLIRQNILAQKHKKYILYQTAKAVLYLHSAGLIHRDLKPSNILVNQSCDAKLCDFGLVRSIEDQVDNKFDMLTQYIATRWYRAPQILLGSRSYSKGIDIWGFGCLAAQMMKGKPLFQGTSTINQLQRVLIWTGPPSQTDIESLKTNFGKQVLQLFSRIKKGSKRQFFTDIDPQCFDLISKCLEFNPSKRIQFQDIVKHPFLSQFYNKQEIILSQKKMKVPIDDNRRLSLRDYRALIYQQIRKRNKNHETFNIQFNQVQQANIYRIRQKPKKTIRTQQSQQTMKQKQKQTIKPDLVPSKKSSTYQNESRTVNIKKSQKSDSIKKKTFYKAQSLQHKNLKTIQPDEQKPLQKHQTNQAKDKDKNKKQTILADVRKTALFKQSNSAGKHLNKVKKSITEGDVRRDKMLTTYMDVQSFYKK